MAMAIHKTRERLFSTPSHGPISPPDPAQRRFLDFVSKETEERGRPDGC